jgi:adenosylhomocysteine nucleosidase
VNIARASGGARTKSTNVSCGFVFVLALVLQLSWEEALAAVVGVAGLAFEAWIAGGKHTRTVCGGNGTVLEAALSRAIVPDCLGLISFGIAGGLSPDLRAGACIVASSIICGAERMLTDRSWSQNALRLIPGAIHGTIAGVSDAVVAHPAAKRALHEKTGANAVDNESHVVARIAATHGLPMVAVRVVMDAASHELPLHAVASVRPDGSIDLGAIARWIVRQPGDLPLLLRTTFDAFVGFGALMRCRRRLGAALGLPLLQARTTSHRPTSAIPSVAIWNVDDEYLERP